MPGIVVASSAASAAILGPGGALPLPSRSGRDWPFCLDVVYACEALGFKNLAMTVACPSLAHARQMCMSFLRLHAPNDATVSKCFISFSRLDGAMRGYNWHGTQSIY